MLRRQAPAAIAVAIAVALLLAAYDRTVGRDLLSAPGAPPRLAAFAVPLATKLLYGGVTEELLTRWGLVSLFAWVGRRVAGSSAHAGAIVPAAAVTLAAILFGIGHLPLLHLIAPAAGPGLVASVLLANIVPGLFFGWLFITRGLEAAIIAHAGAHLLSTLA